MIKKLFLIFMLTFLVCLGEVKITILETSDLHGRIYPYEYAIDSEDKDAGLAKVSTIIKEERNKNNDLILIDSGDTLQGNGADLFLDDEVHPMIKIFNELGYNTWSIGNHEFNYSLDFLQKNINAFSGSSLSSNIVKENSNNYFVNPYKILEIEGVKVAIIGAVPPHVPIWEASSPEHFKGLQFLEPIDAIGNTIKEIEGQYDVLIGSFHLSREGERGSLGIYGIADKYPQFNMIFGGHEHADYVEERNGITIGEPGKYGAYITKGDIIVEKENGKYKVVSKEMINLPTKDVEADKEILDKYKYVHDKSKEFFGEKIGEINDTFIKEVDFLTGNKNVTTMPTAQLKDTSLIELINDVQKKYSKADVSSAALFTPDSNLEKGDFKRKDVSFIYTYPNTLTGVNITGNNLLKYMEWSANYFNTVKPNDITVSFNENIRGYNYDMFEGVDYQIDVSKEPGNRIKNSTINGNPIDKNKVYKLAVNNYRFGTLLELGLINENDKYYDSYEEYQDKGRIRDLIIKYIQEDYKGKVTPSVNNNWEITGFDINNEYVPLLKEKIKSGEIVIPTSEDGRTLNVKSINREDLK